MCAIALAPTCIAVTTEQQDNRVKARVNALGTKGFSASSCADRFNHEQMDTWEMTLWWG